MINDYKAKTPCADCNKTYHPIVMDFDHCRGEKKLGEVGDMSGKASSARILTEMKKCELVCANCHRVRTFKRLRPTSVDGDTALS
jgi:hypothetical protein